MYRDNRLKKRLEEGKKVLGSWSTLGNPFVAEILGQTGFDFIIFDQEHGFGDPAALALQLQAISAYPTTSIVRVPWNDPVYLKRVLDAGVEGVMIPSIETAEEARAAVAACRYPPAGRRGSAVGSIRASNYGADASYSKGAAERLLIVCQIESAVAVGNIDAIAAVEGIDVLFIGPFDLSGSIGQLGNIAHPEVARLIQTAEKGIKASGKKIGTVPHPGLSWRDMLERGYDMITAGSEVRFLRDAGEAAVKAMRAAYP